MIFFVFFVFSSPCTGVPGKGLKEIVRFVYTGKLHCTLDNISDLLLASTHLQLTEATDLCCRYLTNLTNTNNSVDMYNLAEQFNLPLLKNKAMHLILDNFEDIASTRRDYLRFSETFLAEILEDNRLKVSNEIKLFEFVLSWMNHSRSDRVKYMYYLMSRIRFPLIAPHDLVEIVMNEPVMKSDPQCLELIFEANKYHMLPARQPLMQTLRTQIRNDIPSLVVMDATMDTMEGPQVFDLANRNWTSMPTANVDTFHAQLCTMQNFMYVCGGLEILSTNTPVSSKCYRYDPRFGTWCEIGQLQEARHNFTLCSDGRSLFAIGGYSNGTYKSIVEQYLVQNDKWVMKKPMDIPLSSAASVVHDGTVFVSGGQNDMGITRLLTCYNVKTDTWKDCAPMLYSRMDHTIACYGNRIWAIGGYNKNIVKAIDVSKVECFDIETNQWSIVCDKSPKLSGITACPVGNKVYIVGGFSYDENRKKSDVWCFHVEAAEWFVVTKLLTPAMSVPCCAIYLPRVMLQQDCTV